MNPAKNRERKCSTCKHYQPSPLWRKGWCRNPLLYDRNTNHLVEADSLACNRTFIDYWEPMTGPTPQAGPQARSSKPRIAPSIQMDTMDAQGRRSTVTGNTPAAGMAAVAPKHRLRPDAMPERPALSLVTPDFDEEFGEESVNTTLQLDEVERIEGDQDHPTKQHKAAKRGGKDQPKKGFAALWANTRTRMMLMLGILAIVLMAAGGAWYLNRNNVGVKATPMPTATLKVVLPTPTGFGEVQPTVPIVATQPPPPPPSDVVAINGWVQVAGTGAGLVVRDAPARAGKKIITMKDGTQAHIVDGPQEADGFTWWKVDRFDPNNPAASGWCAAQFLTPIPPPAQ